MSSMYIWHRIVNKCKAAQSCQADETTGKTAFSNVSCCIISQLDRCIIISMTEEKNLNSYLNAKLNG